MAEKTQGKKRPLSTPIRVIGQWLDSDFRREDAPNTESLPDKINWERTLPFIFLHLGCLAVFLVGFSWVSAGAAIFLYLLRMFAITGFYHRYFSHRSFKTSRVVQFFFALLGNSSMQRGPLWWAATHRHHHKHSDEKNDAHSPVHHGFAWSHIGWLTSMKNFPTNYKAIPDLKKYPELVFLNRFDQIVPFIYGLIMISAGFILEIFAPSLNVTMWQFFIWTFFISTTVLLHGTLFINSLAHVWGKRRYETKDDSRNSFLLSVITLGEGWHNNHHRYPHSARQGFHAAEIDFTYYGLKTLSWMGLIWDLKPVPSKIKEEGQTLS
jgi:stearoyl-CoA desaturase (delta-9 desaturase)